MIKSFYFLLGVMLTFPLNSSVLAQQNMDQEYADKIKEATTRPEYLNELVDHLPASSEIPSPLDYFGNIAGAPDILHYSHEIYEYMRAVAEASPRVMVRSIGKTEENRDMIEVFIADETTINNLQNYRGYLNTLADPRKINQAEAEEIISKAKPIYYLTGGLHSPETGSPEMLMELVYRLAVDESPRYEKIRQGVITAISPLAEPDGRDRQVDVFRWRTNNDGITPNLSYWGHYVAHDNNRDGYGLALNLTRNILESFLYWKPTIMHDLHESVPFLYVSTGQGPYNPYFDATTIDDWNKLAYNDVNALTRREMPGVWTWGFYNGWISNYLFSIANNRNSVGRFYETYGNHIPQTAERHVRGRSTSKEWFRMNPPLEKTSWSLRNNVNYQQSGVISSLQYTADHSRELLENFYYRSKKSIKLGSSQAPYAFVIPKGQQRSLAAIRLVNLLRTHGIEVHQTNDSISWSSSSAGEYITAQDGAYIVRMDQPYRSMIGTLLDSQHFPDNYDPPYDDVGWTLSYLYQVNSYKVKDPSILDRDAKLLTEDLIPTSNISKESSPILLVNNTTDDEIARFRLQNPDVPMQGAEQSFSAAGKTYAPGSLIINADELASDDRKKLLSSARTLGIDVTGTSTTPDIPSHDLDTPNIALVHTWIPTPQDAGWWRLAFDKLGIPYDYLSTQDFSNMDPAAYDVIILPNIRRGGDIATLVQGTSKAGSPVPWMKTDETPNLGLIDETDDQRRGMGFDGVTNLHKFVQQGGVLITEAGSAVIPIGLGFSKNVEIVSTRNLETHGSVFQASIADMQSPITYGYSDSLAIFFNQAPVFQVDTTVGGVGNYMDPDWLKDERWKKEYPRVVMRFEKNPKQLLLSGMLKGGNELAGKPAIVDIPVEKGHIVMFANRPFWRWQTHGSHSLVLNTILNWNDLHTGRPDRPNKSL